MLINILNISKKKLSILSYNFKLLNLIFIGTLILCLINFNFTNLDNSLNFCSLFVSSSLNDFYRHLFIFESFNINQKISNISFELFLPLIFFGSLILYFICFVMFFL